MMSRIFVTINKNTEKKFAYTIYNIVAGSINPFQTSVFRSWDHEKKVKIKISEIYKKNFLIK